MSSEFVLPQEPAYFTTDQLDRLLIHCYKLSASDISIQTGECVFGEIQGKQRRITRRKVTSQELSDLSNHIYGANATARVYSGTDLDTNYRVKVTEEEIYRFRVNITACYFDGYQGLQITLRTISSSPPKLSDLGVETDLLEKVTLPQGVMIVSGATGSGKSTLLASIVAELAQQPDANLKILTYESPIEYVYDRIPKPSCIISQTEIPRYLPSFAAGVRNALRRKPGLILVGEARDQETIQAAIEAALTGHPVYTTVHANGVADTLRRMVTIFPQAERDSRMFDLLETVKVIIWQALVPTVDGKRTALREYLSISPKVRDFLLEGSVEKLVSNVRKILPEAGQPIWVAAKKALDQGLIDYNVYRRFEMIKGDGYGENE